MAKVEIFGYCSWLRGRNAGPAYIGKNLLCKDFSSGLEPIEVPCTNDVDSESPPYLEYITKSRLIFFLYLESTLLHGGFIFSAIVRIVIVELLLDKISLFYWIIFDLF